MTRSLAHILAGYTVLMIGGSVSGALMVANLKLAPALPAFLPATVLWLWWFWRYARGEGWPRSTSAWRREALTARSLSKREWGWALAAGGLAMTATMGVAFMTYRLATLPDAAYQAPFDVSSLPPWTLVAMFAAIALTAGVVEETAFRGYMLSGIWRRHGWAAGIAIVTLLFYLAHRSHAYARLAFLPFFLVHGLVLGDRIRGSVGVRFTGLAFPHGWHRGDSGVPESRSRLARNRGLARQFDLISHVRYVA